MKENKVHFSGGHAPTLRLMGILNEGETDITPEELVKRALSKNKVDETVLMIRQELVIPITNLEMVEYVVESIEDKLTTFEWENLSQVIEELDTAMAIFENLGLQPSLLERSFNLLRAGRDEQKEGLPISEKHLFYYQQIPKDIARYNGIKETLPNRIAAIINRLDQLTQGPTE